MKVQGEFFLAGLWHLSSRDYNLPVSITISLNSGSWLLKGWTRYPADDLKFIYIRKTVHRLWYTKYKEGRPRFIGVDGFDVELNWKDFSRSLNCSKTRYGYPSMVILNKTFCVINCENLAGWALASKGHDEPPWRESQLAWHLHGVWTLQLGHSAASHGCSCRRDLQPVQKLFHWPWYLEKHP